MSTPGTPPAHPPQSPLSEAVEQAGDAARLGIDVLRRLGCADADALASGRFGLAALATAPVRWYAALATNAIEAVSTTADNLALLTLSGRFGTAEAKRAVRVFLGPPPGAPPGTPSATLGAPLQMSDLVGRLTGFCIPHSKIVVDPATVPADLMVTITAECVAAPADIYTGTLVVADGSATPMSVEVGLAVDEFGVPVT